MDSPVRLSPVPDATHVSATEMERHKAVRKKAVDGSAKPLTVQPLPGWVRVRERVGDRASTGENERAQAPADDAFAAGAALHALDQILRAEPAFLDAFRMRLALKAATAASRLLRVGADEAGLRDTLYLARAGDEPGSAGRVHLILRRFATRPLRLACEALVELENFGDSAGLHEIKSLLTEDIVLAERLGWQQPLPLHLTAIHDPALRRGEEGRRIRVGEPGWPAQHHAVIARAAIRAHAEAVMLAYRTKILIAAAETLRTRDSGKGLALILGDDCVAPWQMAGRGDKGRAGLGSDRAARRFCESLHAKGALRLLTPRPAFRLYGL